MSKKSNWHETDVALVVEQRLAGKTWVEISSKFPGSTPNAIRKLFYRETRDSVKAKPVKILVIDIETLPLVSYTWGLWDQNVSLNQIMEDWSILSYAAKFVGSDKIFYGDIRNEKNKRNDKKLLHEIWDLLDESDIVLGQNSKKFDVKKIKARMILNGLKPPSSFRQIDTMQIAKSEFAFTSNKLEYLSKNLCTKHVKLVNRKFNGFDLWKECLKGNLEAFKELEAYNIEDILSTEELYHKLAPWNKGLNFNVYNDDETYVCSCGSTDYKKHGFVYSNLGKYQRYICTSCGKEYVESENLLDKDKRKSLRK